VVGKQNLRATEPQKMEAIDNPTPETQYSNTPILQYSRGAA